MKEYLVKNKFAEISIDFEQGMVYKKYFENSRKMTIKELKEITETYVNKLVSLYQQGKISANSLNILVDTRNFKLNVSPTLERWIDQKLSTHLLSIVKKVALVFPEKYYKSLNSDLKKAEREALSFDTNCFDSKQMALLWLYQ